MTVDDPWDIASTVNDRMALLNGHVAGDIAVDMRVCRN